MALPTYSTGTVSVDTAGAVTVTGGIWSGTNVVAGDMISVDGGAPILLSDVSDVTHGQIAGWTVGAVSGKTYVAYQCSSLRFDDVKIARDLQKQVAALNTTGFIVFVAAGETAPDPSLGDDLQWATQPSTGAWWQKTGGLWVSSVGPTKGYGGTSTTSLAIGTGSKEFTTQSGLAYNGMRVRASSAANAANWMEGVVSYSGATLTMTVDKVGGSGTFADWVFGIAGQPGDMSSSDNLSTVDPTAARGNLKIISPPQGRLSLTSQAPVMTASVMGADHVYYEPATGNQIPLWDGAKFVMTEFGEIYQYLSDTTKSPSAAAANKNYDKFVWNDAGTIRCTRGPTWDAGAVAGSDTARGTGAGSTELQWINGIPTNKNAITNGPAANKGTYVGSFRTNASSTVDFRFGSSGSGGISSIYYVWNAYNQVEEECFITDNGASYTYTSNVVRWARGGAGMAAFLLVGLPGNSISARYSQMVTPSGGSGAFMRIGIGVDSFDTMSVQGWYQAIGTSTAVGQISVAYAEKPTIGSHAFVALEQGDNINANTFNVAGTAGSFSLRWRL